MILCQREKAIEFHEQALKVRGRRPRGRGSRHSTTSVFNTITCARWRRRLSSTSRRWRSIVAVGDRESEGNALNNLGNAYRNLGQVEKAIVFHEQALEIGARSGHREGEARAILDNLGNAYSSLEQQEKAIEFHDQALAIHCAIGYRLGEGFALCNLGITYYYLGQVEKAIEFYQLALAVLRGRQSRWRGATPSPTWARLIVPWNNKLHFPRTVSLMRLCA